MLLRVVRWLATSFFLASPFHAQGFKLNPRLATLPGTGGDIQAFTVAAGGARVVYRGDQDSDDVVQLYSVVADGTQAPVALSAIAIPDGDVQSYRLSASGTRVAYWANQVVVNEFHLYGVPADGSSAAVQLDSVADVASYELSPDGARVLFSTTSGLLRARASDGSSAAITLAGPYGSVQNVAFAPDGARVVFAADDGTLRLFSVPTDGSAAPVTLAIGLQNGAWFELSPDGSRVVFLSFGVLRSVPAAGGAVVQLSGTPVPGGQTQWFEIDPTGARVLYRADQLADDRFELFSVPIDGSQPAVRLNANLVSGGDVQFGFAASLDGTRAIYRADQEVDERFELYAVPLDGSAAPVKLNGALASGGSVHAALVAADGVRAVYRAEQEVAGRIELYGVPLDGSAPATKLSGSFVPGAIGVSEFAVGTSGVLYLADQDSVAEFELHFAPVDGSLPAQRLSGPMTQGGDVSGPPVEAGGRAFYRADQNLDEAFEVFAAPIDASTPAYALNEPLTHGPVVGNVISAAIAGSTPARYVYLADQDEWTVIELYSASLDGDPRHVRLSQPLSGADDVEYFQISPDGALVAYQVREDGVRDVYSVPSDGSRAPVRLSGPFGPGGSVGVPFGPPDFAISPDGVRVVYRADQQTNDVLELYSAPIDGSAPAVKLNGALAAGGDVQAEFRISADGTRVLYRADQTTTGITELFCAPIDGSQPAVALTPGQGLSFPLWYEFSPDGGSVVYVDDRDTPGVRELYRVASTGGATVKLSGALVAGGNVTAWTSYVRPFSISADSSRVAYLADQNADEVFELFGAPLDGSASAVRLSPPLGGARDVMSFLVSPDSARVVFLADRTDERFELFSAPLDGSAAALKLNGTLPTGGDVAGWADGEPSFRITPRGTRVVYRADELVNNRQDLFAVPTDGSAPSVRLNGAVPAGDIGPWFELMPDGRDVVYLAGGLFSAPLDGAGPQHTLHGPGQTPYEGTAFRFDLAARQVVYRARESGSNVNELFLSFVPRPHRSSGTPDGDATRSAGF